MSGNNDVRIILIDDDAEVRKSVSAYLKTLAWKVEEFISAEDFLRTGNWNHPGCIILDLSMPGMDGTELQEVLIDRNCHLPIIFLSGTGTIPKVVKAMEKGAETFLEKPVNPTILREHIVKAVAKSLTPSQRENEYYELNKRFLSLTEREKDVARLVSQGVLNKNIADKLNVSLNTVKTHRSNCFAKLGVKTAVELTRLMIKLTEVE